MNNLLFDLYGKKAIVTGASRGLGRGAAETLMESGAAVALWSTSFLHDEQKNAYRANGYTFFDIAADISSPEQRKRGFDEAVTQLGGLDILVNAAGVQRRHKAEQFPMEDFEIVINTNLVALFSMCKMAGGLMLSGGGKIINFASMLSYFGGYTVSAYAASKGGVMQLTKALANEWAGYGINVNAIAPGYMDTEMNKALIADEKRNSEILARIPAGRWGTADDLKGAILFLASAASDYIHGAVLPVDGGYLGR